jgi:hypothetical protein
MQIGKRQNRNLKNNLSSNHMSRNLRRNMHNQHKMMMNTEEDRRICPYYRFIICIGQFLFGMHNPKTMYIPKPLD